MVYQMKTLDRLTAIDASVGAWAAVAPDLPAMDMVLMRLVRVASLGITACMEPVLRPEGLTESSYHTLIVVTSAGSAGITPGALCEQLGQTRANMTRILETLHDKGFIAIAEDQHDRRRKQVEATAAGRRLVQRYAKALAPVAALAMSGLTAGDKQVLEKLLRKLSKSMDAAERWSMKAR